MSIQDFYTPEADCRNEIILNADNCYVVIIRGWLNKKTSCYLYDKLKSEIPWCQRYINMPQGPVLEPRYTYFMGDDPNQVHKYSKTEFKPDAWTAECEILKQRVVKETKIPFNAGLLTNYPDGLHHIGMHSDKECLGDYNAVASISLGARRDFNFKNIETGQLIKTYLLSGCGMIMWGDTNKKWKHSVPKRSKADGRISLTLRQLRRDSE